MVKSEVHYEQKIMEENAFKGIFVEGKKEEQNKEARYIDGESLQEENKIKWCFLAKIIQFSCLIFLLQVLRTMVIVSSSLAMPS